MTDLASIARDLQLLAQRVAELVESSKKQLAHLDQPEPCHDNVKPVIDQHEFSAMLGIKPRTLRRKVDDGVVPAPFRVGKKPLWRRAEIETWLAKEKTS